MRLCQRGDLLLRLEQVPGLVVVRSDGVGEPPIGHAAARVGGDGLAETLRRLFMIEAVGPPEPPIEPDLRIVRGGRDLARIDP